MVEIVEKMDSKTPDRFLLSSLHATVRAHITFDSSFGRFQSDEGKVETKVFREV